MPLSARKRSSTKSKRTPRVKEKEVVRPIRDTDKPYKDTILTNVETLNSTEDDYAPFLVYKYMLFTSNRYLVAEGNTLEYTEKAYFSKRKNKRRWNVPKQNGYTWNSDNNTALIGMDEKRLFFYRAYYDDNGEIFVAERIKDRRNPWRAKRLKKVKWINSDYDECSITPLSKDSLLFVSNRNDGNYDIYLRTNRTSAYYPAQPVKELNSEANECDLFYCNYNKTLYFASDRAGGIGGFDIYESKYSDGKFSTPTLYKDTFINSVYDDRDYHRYNDSLAYFASDRAGTMGGLDIYEIVVKTVIPNKKEEIEEPEVPDEVEDQRDELIEKLKELGLFPFRGEVQIGAYRYIKSVDAFYKRFPCIKGEDIKMSKIKVFDKVIEKDSLYVHKFIINKVYTDVYEALDKQFAIEAMKCLPDKEFSDMPFIGMLDKKGNRYAIFWKQDEFASKNVFYLMKNGKQIWKSRKF